MGRYHKMCVTNEQACSRLQSKVVFLQSGCSGFCLPPAAAAVGFGGPALPCPALQLQSTAGRLAGSYAILRAFSWQIRLSPVPFEEFCAALCLPQTSVLMDEIFICLLRTFAQDENKEHRASRVLDMGNLDHITWAEYVWEWLRLTASPLSAAYSTRSEPVDDQPTDHQAPSADICVGTSSFV